MLGVPGPADLVPSDGTVVTPPRPKNTRLRRRLWVTGLVLFLIAWAIAITYSVTAGGRSPERLTDAEAHAVDAACLDAQHALARLPQVGAHASPNARADRLDHENAIFTSMIDRIGALHPTGADPATALTGWLGDWRRLVAARQRFVSDLRTRGNAAAFVEPATKGVEPIVNKMNNWTLEQGTRTDHCNTGELQVEVLGDQRIYGPGSKT
jgi:hypothetical protein